MPHGSGYFTTTRVPFMPWPLWNLQKNSCSPGLNPSNSKALKFLSFSGL